MKIAPSRCDLANPLIEGIPYRPGALVVLRRSERLPGGLRWTLSVDHEAALRHFARLPELRSGRPSARIEAHLFDALRSLLRAGGRAQFCVSSIDAVDIGERRVRLAGRCAPLIADASGAGNLTTRTGWRTG